MHGLLAHPIAAAALVLVAAHGTALSAHGPWFRYIDPDVPAGGYVTLENSGASPAEVVHASSPACGELSLHESVSRGGVDTMHPVPSVTVPPHGSFAFSPGHYHLMCMHPVMHIGAEIPVTLTFKDGSTLAATFPVFGAGGPPRSR